MKALEISNIQKVTLLLMCKKLFPNSKPNFYEGNKIGLWLLDSKGLSEGEYLVLINWFEFCMTHLVDKIFLSIGESRLDSLKGLEYHRIHNNIHLVDYLYKEFKKLKL